ncbi:galactokinase [Galbibacter sp. EGI 63066]|uniref:galactokinase n=1 Tax=Galbibacter sp. EGI 63066 TaxID=2993559 RepID=UPI0022491E7D|nr:galactokinase [Galbibacter sp. EGI 63066]MCX2679189.1 galactokinase [Galbibacter sp. EGI 63066]
MKNTTQSVNRQENRINLEDFKEELVIEAPGRINLIGEHIDYNGGYVLPAAIDKKVRFLFRKNNSDSINVWSKNYETGFTAELSNISPSNTEWHNYILGVIHHIHLIKPKSVKGFDCIVESSLPIGSGLSSSASLECGIATGLNTLFSIGLSEEEIITLSRDAEHEYVGTKCGIMDQFSVVKGEKNYLILLDCQTLDYKLIKSEFSPYQLVLLNTKVSHNLAGSEYNTRRKECDEALAVINKKHFEYKFLADVPVDVVESFKNELPEKVYNRALYVVQENKRTLMAAEAIEDEFFGLFGKLMYESHEGLKHLYEVSCDELDFLVDFSKDRDYVLGSRMMGGGFGGCTINLIHQDHVKSYIEKVSKAYKEKFGIELAPIEVNISKGVSKK